MDVIKKLKELIQNIYFFLNVFGYVTGEGPMFLVEEKSNNASFCDPLPTHQ